MEWLDPDTATIDDDLLGAEIQPDDITAGNERLYQIAKSLGLADDDIDVNEASTTLLDFVRAVACARRARLKAGRQPYGEPDAYFSKAKLYQDEITRLAREITVADFTGDEPTAYDAVFSVDLGRA